MHTKRSFFLIFLLIGFLFFNAQIIRACQCGGQPTVIQSFERSENVFIGEITKFSKPTATSVDNHYGVTISVQKVFKGSLKEGDSKFFAQGSGDDCRWEFNEKMIGTKILIYDSDYRKRPDLRGNNR